MKRTERINRTDIKKRLICTTQMQHQEMTYKTSLRWERNNLQKERLNY